MNIGRPIFALVAAGLIGLGSFALAPTADAQTCNSVCNQVGRACGVVAKGDKKAGKIQCVQDKESCKSCLLYTSPSPRD